MPKNATGTFHLCTRLSKRDLPVQPIVTRLSKDLRRIKGDTDVLLHELETTQSRIQRFRLPLTDPTTQFAMPDMPGPLIALLRRRPNAPPSVDFSNRPTPANTLAHSTHSSGIASKTQMAHEHQRPGDLRLFPD